MHCLALHHRRCCCRRPRSSASRAAADEQSERRQTGMQGDGGMSADPWIACVIAAAALPTCCDPCRRFTLAGPPLSSRRRCCWSLLLLLRSFLGVSPAALSSSARKQRAAHFQAHSTARRKIMSSPLEKDLRKKYNVRTHRKQTRVANAAMDSVQEEKAATRWTRQQHPSGHAARRCTPISRCRSPSACDPHPLPLGSAAAA